MTIGERIRQRRTELGMTQDELAQRIGYRSRSSVNKLENARVLPSRKIEKMAEVLECSPSYLMGWAVDPDPNNHFLLDMAFRTGRREDSPLVQDMIEHEHTMVLEDDERTLVLGFRAAPEPVRDIMLDAAKNALKKRDMEKSSASTDEDIA